MLTSIFMSMLVIMPPPCREGHHKMGIGVSLSVRLSVCLSYTCFDLTRDWKGVGSPKLAEWKPITRVARYAI